MSSALSPFKKVYCFLKQGIVAKLFALHLFVDFCTLSQNMIEISLLKTQQIDANV